MDREIRRIDSSHIEFTFHFRSTSEAAEWRKCFPDPVPSSEKFVFEWKGAMKLVCRTDSVGRIGENDHASARSLMAMDRPTLETLAVERGVKVTRKMTDAQLAGETMAASRADGRTA